MPIGWLYLADPDGRSFRAFPAFGGQLFADYRLGPIFSAGVSGALTGNVIPNRSDYVVGTMFAGSVRLGVRLPLEGSLVPFALVSGGYSSISLAGGSEAQGALVEGTVGVRLRLGPTHALLGQIGYQHGFQTLDGGAYSPSYLVTEVGWSMAL